MSAGVLAELVALVEGLPPEPTPAQLVAAREAFDLLLSDYEPTTEEERGLIDDMADLLAAEAD